MNAFDLTGKSALVTGGNSGIGLGMAMALAKAGANVCIWGRKEAVNAEAVDAIGNKAFAIQCDVSDESAVDRAFASLTERVGPVHACFANAGIAGTAVSFSQMSTEEWRRVLSINLDGAFFTLRKVAAHMAEHGEGGSLVATASLAAMEGQPRGQHYAASKGALISMMKALAVEYARYGVRANAIVPGWVESGMTDSLFKWDKFADSVMRRIPMRRWGTGEDFAGVAVYLASDASRYHTGDTLVIDGGYSIF